MPKKLKRSVNTKRELSIERAPSAQDIAYRGWQMSSQIAQNSTEPSDTASQDCELDDVGKNDVEQAAAFMIRELEKWCESLRKTRNLGVDVSCGLFVVGRSVSIKAHSTNRNELPRDLVFRASKTPGTKYAAQQRDRAPVDLDQKFLVQWIANLQNSPNVNNSKCPKCISIEDVINFAKCSAKEAVAALSSGANPTYSPVFPVDYDRAQHTIDTEYPQLIRPQTDNTEVSNHHRSFEFFIGPTAIVLGAVGLLCCCCFGLLFYYMQKRSVARNRPVAKIYYISSRGNPESNEITRLDESPEESLKDSRVDALSLSDRSNDSTRGSLTALNT